MQTILEYAVLWTPLAAILLFGMLSWWLRVYPRLPVLIFAAVPAMLSFSVLFSEAMAIAVVAIDLLILLVLLVDLLTLPRPGWFKALRSTVRVASIGKQHRVLLSVENQSGRSFRMSIRDDVDPSFRPEPREFAQATVPAETKMTVRYTIQPSQRGKFIMETAYVRILSAMRLWDRLIECPVETTVNVYPDLKQLSEYALLARTNRLSQMGVRRIRRVGQDHDFERLRDYTPDDNYKNIDWRTSAKRQKLTVKDFQSSRSQRIIFLVDAGRMMTNQSAGLSLLDHSLNAMLMLSYIALNQGDAVGMICFSDRIHNYVPPKSGMAQMTRMLHACFDRFPTMVESRYDEAFRYLATHCRKRSLVVMITNLIDEMNASQIEKYMTNLVGRHLPLGVLLRDHRLFDAVEPEYPHGRELWRAGAAADILNWRLQTLADLNSKGAMTLDVFPEDMTAPMINQYLEIKARHLL